MAGRQPFSLQAWPAVDKDKESLQFLISRINDQKGSFRNVTEESLEEELRDAEVGKADGDENIRYRAEEEEDITDAEDPKIKRDSVYKARGEILKHIGSVTKSCRLCTSRY